MDWVVNAYELANFLSETASEIQVFLPPFNTFDDFFVMRAVHNTEV